jgi:hypothetical protein
MWKKLTQAVGHLKAENLEDLESKINSKIQATELAKFHSAKT